MRKLILLVLATAACASQRTSQGTDAVSTGPTRVIGTTTNAEINIQVDKQATGGTVPFPIARVWAVLPAAYKAIGIPVEYADDRARELGNTRFTTRSMLNQNRLSTYLRCGQSITGPIADTYRIRMNVRTALKPVGTDSTNVSTLVEAIANSVEGSSGNTQECTSAGTLENAIVKRLMWEAATAK